MKEKDKSRARRIRNLVIIFALTAIIISVSTYAWFIGMKTVHVNPFEIEIASTESLMLSLDGKRWDATVNISEATLNDVSYANHTNSWGNGLVPVSTVGEMDKDASRMKLYEKASLTATPGGYRFMSSRVPNWDTAVLAEPEPDGYVVFDLFIKNFSGRQYIPENEILDEEAIYLTTDSKVEVSASGTPAGVGGTGIENSVRVAFAQIGRVNGNETDPDKITSVTCASGGTTPSPTSGTGICRTAQIWEPNDTKHEAAALKWYEVSCKARTGANVTLPASYAGPCETLVNGTAYPTYAINKEITSANNVDVYDGEAYNGYTASIDSEYLAAFDYFTDTMRDQVSIQRQEIFTLAPNSITKVRIYVYLEGQDIDNFDYASIGRSIDVKFGFTKERFVPGDIHYGGPAFDNVKPVIVLDGSDTMAWTTDTPWVEPGYTATDDIDGDITRKVVIDGEVDVTTPGEYTLVYKVSDWQGNYATPEKRVVTVGP